MSQPAKPPPTTPLPLALPSQPSTSTPAPKTASTPTTTTPVTATPAAYAAYYSAQYPQYPPTSASYKPPTTATTPYSQQYSQQQTSYAQQAQAYPSPYTYAGQASFLHSPTPGTPYTFIPGQGYAYSPQVPQASKLTLPTAASGSKTASAPGATKTGGSATTGASGVSATQQTSQTGTTRGPGRKGTTFKGAFVKDLRPMMYGFGDDPNPAPDTVNVMEEILMEYMVDVCYQALKPHKKPKIKLDDLRRVLSRPPDAKKLARMEELLFMREDINRARAQFDENEGMVVPRGGNAA
ncbi:hypothetical protein FRC03_001540 [Tulasnella sp. 419]|nr:hypothetical protein FRC03_001540 [Tulasnella sp. 419]